MKIIFTCKKIVYNKVNPKHVGLRMEENQYTKSNYNRLHGKWKSVQYILMYHYQIGSYTHC